MVKPDYERDGIKLYCGDNVAVMSEMEAESIDLVVTSPPYDNLRTYGGHTWDFEGVAAQLKRLLKPGGVIVWVVNDATVDGSETGTSFRQALHFKDIGLRLHDTMIWQKEAISKTLDGVRMLPAPRSTEANALVNQTLMAPANAMCA